MRRLSYAIRKALWQFRIAWYEYATESVRGQHSMPSDFAVLDEYEERLP